MTVIFYVRDSGENHEWGSISNGEVVSDEGGFEEWVENERALETTPDFNDEDMLISTYEGPFIVTEWGEDPEEDAKEISKTEEIIVGSMKRNGISFDDVFESISTAYDNTVWWAYNEDSPDLSKSPNMWNEANPSEEAKQWIEAALEHDPIYGEYVGLPRLAPINIERMYRRRLRRDQGFRIEDIVDDLMDLFPSIDEDKALNIARTETSALLDTAKDLAHDAEMAEIEEEADSPEEVEEEEPKFVWEGPNDESTTDICSKVGEITEERNGVTLDELQDLLKRHARKSKSGTPGRVNEWSPHYQCRRTFERVN